MLKNIIYILILLSIKLSAQNIDTLTINYDYNQCLRNAKNAFNVLYKYTNDYKYKLNDFEVLPIPILSLNENENYNCNDNIEYFIDNKIDCTKLYIAVLRNGHVYNYFLYDDVIINNKRIFYPWDENPKIKLDENYNNEIQKLIESDDSEKKILFSLNEKFFILKHGKLYTTDYFDDDLIIDINDYIHSMGEKYIHNNGILLGEEYTPCNKTEKSKKNVYFEILNIENNSCNK